MRQARQVLRGESARSRTPPHREHTTSLSTGISAQQASQIGADERSGRGEPQRAQPEGSKTQPIASTGLRRTRTTARHAEVPDGGTLSVSAFGSLRKTHLVEEKGPMQLSCHFPCFYIHSFTGFLQTRL